MRSLPAFLHLPKKTCTPQPLPMYSGERLRRYGVQVLVRAELQGTELAFHSKKAWWQAFDALPSQDYCARWLQD
jgi:hypothetical protein